MTLETSAQTTGAICAALEVEESQHPSGARALLPGVVRAYGEGPWRPIAMRVADEVVGFVMWGIDSADGGLDRWTDHLT